MSPLRRVVLLLWAAAAVAGLLAVTVFGDRLLGDAPAPAVAMRRALPGGDFTMADHRGRTFTQADLRGRPSLVFFGFTHCPDVCPTTLSDMSGWLADLGGDADRLAAVFVSVDPDRDTPEVLRPYMEPFDPRIRALTGTAAELQATAAHFGAAYRRVETSGAGGYTMDHTALVYMLDAGGRFFGTVDFHEERAIAIAKLRRLLAEGS
ncbi:SCO family protein [Stella sp.]|uniref:SCO family protein n=1 Tax=Stella sp. TaxID=2912054 RepID=UPI0035B2CB81